MTSSETAEGLRRQAAQLRDAATQARTQQDTTLAHAQAEAQRLINNAKQTAAQLRQAAAEADRGATELEERAGVLAEAEQLDVQVPQAERRALDLAGESDSLQQQIQDLHDRVSSLGGERSSTAAALVAARDRGDVEEVVTAQIRLDAIEQVVGALSGQRQALCDRLTEIGTPESGGELQRALGVWRQLAAKHRHAWNQLDPQRPEAVADRALENFKTALEANMERIQQEQKPAEPVRRVQVG